MPEWVALFPGSPDPTLPSIPHLRAEGDINDEDEQYDETEEFEAWKVRELTRIKRDQDKRAVRWPGLSRDRVNPSSSFCSVLLGCSGTGLCRSLLGGRSTAALWQYANGDL